MRWFAIPAVLVFCMASVPKWGRREECPNPLQSLMVHSDLIVSARIKGRPTYLVTDAGTRKYFFALDDLATLHGKPDAVSKIDACLERPEHKGEELPFFVDGANCIVFLKRPPDNVPDYWRVTDPWFGIQPMNKQLAARIEGASKMMAKGKYE